MYISLQPVVCATILSTTLCVYLLDLATYCVGHDYSYGIFECTNGLRIAPGSVYTWPQRCTVYIVKNMSTHGPITSHVHMTYLVACQKKLAHSLRTAAPKQRQAQPQHHHPETQHLRIGTDQQRTDMYQGHWNRPSWLRISVRPLETIITSNPLHILACIKLVLVVLNVAMAGVPHPHVVHNGITSNSMYIHT